MIDWWLEEKSTLQEKKIDAVKTLTMLKSWNWDIPERLLSGLTAEPYKVRKNRFAGLVATVSWTCHQLFIDKKYESIKKESIEEAKYFCNDEFKDRLTTKEDIEKWDALIDKLLAFIENM